MNPLLFIPCYNHTDQINNLLINIDKYYKDDILVIDDGSEHELPKISLPNVTIKINDKNMGKGQCIIKASKYMNENNYSHLIVLDSDNQHDPSKIIDFLNVDERVDLVYGKRSFNKPMPLSRIISNTITSSIISILCNKHIYDSQCGYRRYSANMFKNEIYKEKGYQFETEILLKKINKKSKVKHIDIPTIYNNSSSSMNYINDTFKFIKCVLSNLI